MVTAWKMAGSLPAFLALLDLNGSRELEVMVGMCTMWLSW